MWGNKNPDAPKTAQPEQKAPQAEKANKASTAAGSTSENTAPSTVAPSTAPVTAPFKTAVPEAGSTSQAATGKSVTATVDSTPPAATSKTENAIKNTPSKPAFGEREEKRTMSNDALKPSEPLTPSGSIARLGSFLHIKGEITGSEDLQIDGTVEGLVQLDEKKLIVGTSAKLTTDIIAREIIVLGSVKGNLHAKERIELKKEASVQGDLTTARILIEEGAYFKGSIEIDRTGEKTATKHANSTSTSTSTPATVSPKSL
ncbi:MAG: polymer-forming cytoskeletal protein [Acidobacteriia bacterium]|nr:polymer-forming cytoskeletal protein [Terriglobia bacterium]